VGIQIDDLNQNLLSNDAVNDVTLLPQSRRPMPFPLASQHLVSKRLDQSEPLGTGDSDNVLPLFVSFQDLDWQAVQLS